MLDLLEGMTVYYNGEVPANDASDVIIRLDTGVELHPLCFKYIEAYFDIEKDENCVKVPTLNGNGSVVGYTTATRGAVADDDAYVLANVPSTLLDNYAISSDKQWLVSCIIPIYNVEKYLNEAIDSVISQSIGFVENVQLILVNDGSPDGCGAICETYKAKYPENVVYIEQENRGVSAARNVGLDVAGGEFVAFLDGDDRYDARFMEVGIEFLRAHGDEVDFVAMPINLFGNIKSNQKHQLNHRFSEADRIIDVNTDFTDVQVNVAGTIIKSKSAVLFDTKLTYYEDVDFIHRVLLNNSKYGVTAESSVFCRERSDSLIKRVRNEYSFDFYHTLQYLPSKWFENSLAKLGAVAVFEQFLAVRLLSEYKIEKISGEMLAKIDREPLLKTLAWIAQNIDDEIIKLLPSSYRWQKYYFYLLKYDEVQFKQIDTLPGFYFGDRLFAHSNPIVWLCQVEEQDGIIFIWGYYNLPISKKTKLVVRYNKENYSEISHNNMYKDAYYLGIKIHKANVFEVSIPYSADSALEFYLEIEGFGFSAVRLSLVNTCRLSDKKNSFVLGDKTIITYLGQTNVLGVVQLNQVTLHQSMNAYINALDLKKYGDEIDLLSEYMNLYSSLSKPNIWLFMDRKNKADDNAEHLFRYSKSQKNAARMIYVIEETASDIDRLKKIGEVVFYGSKEHKILALFAKFHISSQSPFDMVYPFGTIEQISIFKGLVVSKLVFLQHGITFRDVSRVFNKLNRNIKLFVTAVKGEYDSIINNENYLYSPENVKLTGFPRFDNLWNDPQKEITLLLTWRKAFYNPAEEYDPRFKESLYCNRLNLFLNDARLLNAANEYGYTIAFRPHPLVYAQIEDFRIDPKVKVVPLDYPYQQSYAEASLIISDFSSSIFDFAYLKKPCVYYHFDEDHYDPDYFDYATMGFGEIVNEHSDLVDLLIRYMKDGCVMDDVYTQRVDDFFAFNDRDNCKRVYDAVLALS
jgi:CDP-glycerol glycerophosphotransferase (TagB/SpsB family)/GT2 family glycosyltransferase